MTCPSTSVNYASSDTIAGLSPRSGFTLVELLIVISIIAVLASLVIAGLGAANAQKNLTAAKMMISNMKLALDNYRTDEPGTPGFGLESDEERNDFPLLWAALMNDPSDGGGSSAQYMKDIPKDKIAVLDQDDDGKDYYRVATRDERDDPEAKRYLLDPWGNPYMYRCNKGLEPQDYMINRNSFDIYSWGPNGVDDTVLLSEGDDNDDVQ